MNFFSAQNRAKKYTRYLQFLFIVAMTSIIAFANYMTYLWIYYNQLDQVSFSFRELSTVYDQSLTIVISCIIMGFIVVASFYRLITLRSGGRIIAETMGGHIISHDSEDPEHKLIINIVNEMAIASGMSVPPIYLLNENGINAFVAGWKPSNSVIGITKGALKQLNRDELQGVVAHEFSHIFNGDMKINLSLIAHLYGIVLIGESGKLMMRAAVNFDMESSHYRRSNNSYIILPLIALGFSFYIVGAIGMLLGGLVKALINHQREYLADASAVQYTRNQEGIANALKKIGGTKYHAHIRHNQADIYSHGYFSQSSHSAIFSLFATHPPLEQRISRIQPKWDGTFIEAKRPQIQSEKLQPLKKKQIFKQAIIQSISTKYALDAIHNVGNMSDSKVSVAKQWLQSAPEFIPLYAQSSPDAEWLIYALLIDSNPNIQQKQWHILKNKLSENELKQVRWLNKNIQTLDHHYDSLVVELALPALRRMSKNQYKIFHHILKLLIKADNKIDLREWCIQYVITYQLNDFFGLRKKTLMPFYLIGSAKHAIETVLSLLAYIEYGKTLEARKRFNLGVKSIGATTFKIVDKNLITLTLLDQSMGQLQKLKTPLKKNFLMAAISCIAHDQDMKPQSFELLRTIANAIDLPLPPIYVAKNVS